MGTKPSRPILDPGVVPSVADPEVLRCIRATFHRLAQPGPKGHPAVTARALAASSPSFTSRYGSRILDRVIDIMDMDGSKVAKEPGFCSTAFAASCGTRQQQLRVLFNLFDVSHKGEISQRDFAAVYATIACARKEAPGSSDGVSADDVLGSLAPLQEQLGKVIAVGVFERLDPHRTGRISFPVFQREMSQDDRLEALRRDLSQLLAPRILG